MALLAISASKLIGAFSQLGLQCVSSSLPVIARGIPTLTTGASLGAVDSIKLSSQVAGVSALCSSQPLVSPKSLRQFSNHVWWNANVTGLALAKSGTCNLSCSIPMLGNSLMRMHRIGIRPRPPRQKNPLGYDKPMMRGVVLKTVIRKPKKPNSANRKCVLVRLSNGKEMVAFVPGEGHTLQEHNVVMVRPGRLRDTPGVKIRCIRGCYDLGHVVKKTR